MKLLYVLPYAEQHVGIRLKIEGQIEALAKDFLVIREAVIPARDHPQRVRRRVWKELKSLWVRVQ